MRKMKEVVERKYQHLTSTAKRRYQLLGSTARKVNPHLILTNQLDLDLAPLDQQSAWDHCDSYRL
jgi:hypothetical protein